jgi:Xaa-Pro aminopeptidase
MRNFLRLLLALGLGLPRPGELTAQSDVAFPPEVYSGRRARLMAQIGDGVAIVPGRYLVGAHELPKPDPNFWYLSGVESPYAILVLSGAEKRTALFLPERFQFAGGQYPMVESSFRRAVWNRPPRRLAPGPEVSAATGIPEVFPIDDFASKLIDLVGGARTIHLPLDQEEMYAPPGLKRPLSVAQQMVSSIVERLPGRKVENLAPPLARMRLVKDEFEIAALRRAAEISGEGLIEAMKAVRPGMNELEVAGILEYTWKRLGSPRASFAPIVGSGPHGMIFFTVMGENYNAVDRVMQAGELLFLDYGAAEYRTYAADLCRTLPVSGRFTPEQRKYYDIVLEAQEAAIARIKPGALMVDAVRAAAEVFRRHGLEPFEDVRTMGEDRVWGIMPSPTHYLARREGIVRYSALGIGVRDLGHHIGLEVSDSRDYSRPLEAGWVFTVEPKIYIPEKQIGIMIEDMVLVTPQGSEVLSARTPKRAEDIERIMRASP